MRQIYDYLSLFLLFSMTALSMLKKKNQEELFTKRMELYQKVESITNIPWYYLAAIDQYERNVRQSRKILPKAEGITGIYFPPEEWIWSDKSESR